eukprot:TRINITY_DN56605_c0_g1_i1.p1 TRINITY_DN56605_c0_g1~~TRINITY_DN56605_c0_g1_i1.p1  ORF type:complete len:394 (+),score=11.99 TRINITY_DN56605_c0_g1_i1:171-1184(+)
MPGAPGWGSMNESRCYWLYVNCRPEPQQGQPFCEKCHVFDFNMVHFDLPPGSCQLPDDYLHPMSSLKWLVTFDVGDNNVGGRVPPSVTKIRPLKFFDVGRNNMTGPLPPFHGSNTPNLAHVGLPQNDFSGGLPSSYGTLKNLKKLSLNENRLNGTLPPEWAKLKHLTYLRLGNNKLTGEIPKEWSALAYNPSTGSGLQEIDLSFNQLTGDIPHWVLKVPTHSLQGNNWTTPIPSPPPPSPHGGGQPSGPSGPPGGPSGHHPASRGWLLAVAVVLLLIICGVGGGYYAFQQKKRGAAFWPFGRSKKKGAPRPRRNSLDQVDDVEVEPTEETSMVLTRE